MDHYQQQAVAEPDSSYMLVHNGSSDWAFLPSDSAQQLRQQQQLGLAQLAAPPPRKVSCTHAGRLAST